MDVKTGSGAFMKDYEDARALAQSIVGVANGAGVKTSALLTDMNEPLAGAAGNALEVYDAIKFLRGEGERPRLETVVMSLSAELLVLGDLAPDRERARRDLKKALDSGKAAEAFSRMVSGLGGPSDLLERPEAHLPSSPVKWDAVTRKGGWIDQIDTRELGLAILELGGGRTRAEDGVDYGVGLSGFVELGQKVEPGDALCVVHANSEDEARRAGDRILKAITLSDQQAAGQPVVYELIEG